MSERSESTPSHQADAVAEWVQEANQEFFGQPKEPITGTTVGRAFIGFLVVAIGAGWIVWQVLGAS